MISSDSTLFSAAECLPIDHGGPVNWPFEPMSSSLLEGSIIDRFEAVVHRHSARLAVSDTRRNNLTYAELAHLVDQIAKATVAATADHPGPVAILLPPDAYFPAALLGVLAAGRGYVPLDVSVAIERNRLIVLQSGAAAVISVGELASHIRTVFPEQLPIVAVDAVGQAAGTSRPKTRPNDLAAIVYTSGTTGRPKGVYMNHRILLHSVMQSTNGLHVNEEDRVICARSPAFIGATRDVLLALLNGASLHFLPPLELQPTGIVDEIQARGITIFRGSPTLLRRIAEVLDRDQRLNSVRAVQLTSERAEWSDFDVFRRIFPPDAYLSVIMGLTEGPATYWFVDDAVRAAATRLPAGRVLPDRTLSVVDDNGNPMADGVIGELVLTSRYLALGYWRDPEATTRAFTVDPTDPEIRTFKTGDLGRRRPDGLYEHVGRKDDQIKLHGHRIEPVEIESTLRNCAGVRDAAIVVRKNEDGVARSLAAYVEARADVFDLSSRDLIAVLVKHLPRHMVPSPIIIIDALPRLENLKIDRVRLAQMDARRLDETVNPIDEPRTQLEDVLTTMWACNIGIERVGLHDNFFDIGGDSLAAMQLIAGIELVTGKRLTITALFEAPTIKELAALIEHDAPGLRSYVVPIQGKGSGPPFFCVNAGPDYLSLARHLGTDQPLLGLLYPSTNLPSGATSHEAMAEFTVKSIRAVQPEGPYFVAGWSNYGLVAYEIAQQLQAQGQEVALLTLFDVVNPGRLDKLSAVHAIFARADELCRKVWFHLRWMTRLKFRDVPAYFLERLKGIWFTLGRRTLLPRGAREFFRPVLPSDLPYMHLAAMRRYRPKPYNGRVLLFRRGLRAISRHLDTKLGWGSVIVGEFNVVEIQGGHGDMFLEPQVQRTAAELASYLRDPQQS